MKRLISIPIWLSLLAGCTSSPRYDPFSVDPAAIGRETVIVLAPVTSAGDIEIPDSLFPALEDILSDSLFAAGLNVIPSAAFSGIWETIMDDLGGIYDPRTGDVVPDKQATARQRLADELTHQFRAGSILYPEIILVDAEFQDGVARWDGASQAVAGFWARFADILHAVADGLSGEDHGSSLPRGFVAALSLQVILEDLDGIEMYTNWGGLEVVADDETGEPLPAAELFQDLERLHRAVGISLRPLLESLQTPVTES